MTRRDVDTALRIVHLREPGQARAECGRLLGGTERQVLVTDTIGESTCVQCLRKFRNRMVFMQTLLRGKA